MLALCRSHDLEEAMKTENTTQRPSISVVLAATFFIVKIGLIWAALWGLVGVLIAVFLDPNETVTDIWAALCMPGFVGGVVFSVVLWIAEGRRRFNELSLRRLAAWGAVTGLLLGVVSFAVGTPSGRFSLLLLVVVFIGSTTLLSAVSGVASALLFRHSAWERPPADAGQET
jgi:hypothetical protein